MSSICINISNLDSGWNPIVGKAQKCTEYIDNSKEYIKIVRKNLDYRIKNKNSIGERLESINQSVNEISNQIENIEVFLNNSISKYTAAEQRVNQLAIDYGILEPEKNLSEKWNEWLGSWFTEEGKFDFDRLWDVGEATLTFIGKVASTCVLATMAVSASGPLAIAGLVAGTVILANESITAAIDPISSIHGDNSIKGLNILEYLFTSLGGDIGKGVYWTASAVANMTAFFGGFGNLSTGLNLKEIWAAAKPIISSPKSWSNFISDKVIMPLLLQGGIIEGAIKTGLKGSHAEKALMFVANMGGDCLDFFKKVFNPKEFINLNSVSDTSSMVAWYYEKVYKLELPDEAKDALGFLAGGIDGYLESIF